MHTVFYIMPIVYAARSAQSIYLIFKSRLYKAPWAPTGFKVSLSLVEYGVKNFF